MSKFMVIFKREYLQIVKKKSFIIGIFLTPAFMALIMLAPAMLVDKEPDQAGLVAVIDRGEQGIGEQFAESLEQYTLGETDNPAYDVTTNIVDKLNQTIPSNVVPISSHFATKANSNYGNVTTNYVDKVNQTVPSNVVPISSHIAFSERIENQKNANTNTHSTIGTAKVEKSEFASQLQNSFTNTTKEDNSKRVHVDNLTVKSDDAFSAIEQLMELAG